MSAARLLLRRARPAAPFAQLGAWRIASARRRNPDAALMPSLVAIAPPAIGPAIGHAAGNAIPRIAMVSSASAWRACPVSIRLMRGVNLVDRSKRLL